MRRGVGGWQGKGEGARVNVLFFTKKSKSEKKIFFGGAGCGGRLVGGGGARVSEIVFTMDPNLK